MLKKIKHTFQKTFGSTNEADGDPQKGDTPKKPKKRSGTLVATDPYSSGPFATHGPVPAVNSLPTLPNYDDYKRDFEQTGGSGHPHNKSNLCGNSKKMAKPNGTGADGSMIPACTTDIQEYDCRRKVVSKDDFVVVKNLGQGNFAKVFLVQKIDNGKLYAMKVVDKALMLDKGRVCDLFSERNVLKRSKHPFIVKLDFTFQSERQLFFVMEHLEGGDLLQYFKRLENGRFSEEQTRFYAAEIFLALQYLHDNNVIYRDLKPSNILLDEQGHICLADMGLCKIFETDSATSTNLPGNDTEQLRRCSSFVGSPAYVAPEILLRKRYDNSVDWWSFGILIFRMLCGVPPFEGKSVIEIFDRILRKNPDFRPYPWVSETARDLIQKLLQKTEANRLRGIDVKAHPFFAGIRWKEIFQKKAPPPNFIPPPGANPSSAMPSAQSSLGHIDPVMASPTIGGGDTPQAADSRHRPAPLKPSRPSAHELPRVSVEMASPTRTIDSAQQQLFHGFSFVANDECMFIGDETLSMGRTESKMFQNLHPLDSFSVPSPTNRGVSAHHQTPPPPPPPPQAPVPEPNPAAATSKGLPVTVDPSPAPTIYRPPIKNTFGFHPTVSTPITTATPTTPLPAPQARPPSPTLPSPPAPATTVTPTRTWNTPSAHPKRVGYHASVTTKATATPATRRSQSHALVEVRPTTSASEFSPSYHAARSVPRPTTHPHPHPNPHQPQTRGVAQEAPAVLMAAATTTEEQVFAF